MYGLPENFVCELYIWDFEISIEGALLKYFHAAAYHIRLYKIEYIDKKVVFLFEDYELMRKWVQ